MKRFVTAQEIQQQYSIPVGTLARWRCEGIGPSYHKPKGRVLYDAEEFDSFIRKSRIVPSVRAAMEERHG